MSINPLVLFPERMKFLAFALLWKTSVKSRKRNAVMGPENSRGGWLFSKMGRKTL